MFMSVKDFVETPQYGGGSSFLLKTPSMYVPLEWESLRCLFLDLFITDEDRSSDVLFYEDVVGKKAYVIIDDEASSLCRDVARLTEQNKRLSAHNEELVRKVDSVRDEVSDIIIHAFMPSGYASDFYLDHFRRTPYRRGIANALFLLKERGYRIPDDTIAFMERYKTKRTKRR